MWARDHAKLGARGLIALAGVAVLAAGLAVPSDQGAARATRVAGLLITLGAVMLIARSRIQTVAQRGFRRWLWTAWFLAGTGLLLLAIGTIMTFLSGGRAAGEMVGITGYYTFVLGPASVGLLGWLIKVVGTWRVVATSGLLMTSLFALPPLVVLVAGQTPRYALGPQATGAAGAGETLVLLVLVSAVIFLPMYIATWRSWDDASKSTRRVLPDAAAILATGATIVYAVILHASKGPLDDSSLTKVIIAGLITAVFLRPLYRYLAMTCWRWGSAEVFVLKHWREAQMKMLRELFAAWRAVELQQGNPKASREPVPQRAAHVSGKG